MSLRDELHALVDRIADEIEKTQRASEYYSQKDSPLGAEKHLRYAREGLLPSSRDGRLVLILRADIDAYLAKKKQPVKVDTSANEDAEAERIAAGIGRRR